MLSLISLIMYFAFGWRHLAGSFSSTVLWNKAVTQQDFLTGVRLYLMAAESGKEITEPWFQKYKLGNGIALFLCQHIGTETGEIVICEGKCSIVVNLICILIYFPCLLKKQHGLTVTAVPKTFTGAVHATAASSARDISLPVANIIFYLADVSAGSLVPAPFCFPCSSQPCSCLANSLSASFTSQCLLNTVPKSRTSPPLWLAAQFAAVAACSATSLWKCSLELWSWVLEEGNEHWGKKYPTESAVRNSS